MIEIKLLLIGLLISSIFNFRRKTGVLYCGVFGACMDPRFMSPAAVSAVIAKIKILGLFNQERGKDSCGIFANNVIEKGIEKEKKWSDFVEEKQIPNPSNKTGNFVFIGHTRMSTIGTHSEANAHPFLIDDDFVLAHNGVIHNIRTLTNKYDLKDNYVVDSNGLAFLIARHGYKILNEYEGYAALLMTRISEPNSIWIYHGSSKNTSAGQPVEERPLFTMQTREGIYISSLASALKVISENSKDQIRTVEHNVVQKITNGHVTKAKFQVEREENNVYTSRVHVSSPNSTANSSNRGSCSVAATQTTRNFMGTKLDVAPPPLIWYENLPQRAEAYGLMTGVFFHKGRYWKINGMTSEITLMHGGVWIGKDGVIDDTITNYRNEWFYNGVYMKNEKAFNELTNNREISNPWSNPAQIMSRFAEYPVVNTKAEVAKLSNSSVDSMKYRYFKNGLAVKNDGFTPKWSDISYALHDGILTDAKHQYDTTKNGQILDRDAYFKDNVITGEQKSSLDFILGGQSHGGNTVSKEKPSDSNFYMYFDSIKSLMNAFTKLELDALKFYIADLCTHEMEIPTYTIHQEHVHDNMMVFLEACIAKEENIYENWDPTSYHSIEYYLKFAQQHPDGIIPDEQEEYYLLPAKTVDVEDNVDKNFMIDHAVALETAKVPIGKVPFVTDEEPDDDSIVDAVIENDDVLEVENDENLIPVTDVVDNFAEIREAADEMTMGIDEDDEDANFYNEMAFLLYTKLDGVYNDMIEIAEKHEKKNLVHYLKIRQAKMVGTV